METTIKTSLSGLISKNLTTYKITVSIIFGLLGFIVNFYTISFSFLPYTATVLIGLLFPMLIARTWGWKYGLLSALAGGCQSIWWLWGSSNGYAVFVVVPPFTLWIIWHGLFADLRKKRKDYKWWLSAYAVEIPFRILSTISLLTLARWAITLNPPPWSWASSAANTIPLQFSVFVAVKQSVIGYIILLLADVLLNFRLIRRFFILEEKISHANTDYVISASLLFGVLFWVVDSVLGCLIFHPENTFIDLLALNIPPYVFFVRFAFIVACLAGGVLVSSFLRKRHETENRYHLLTETANDLIISHDLEGRITYGNKAALETFGFNMEELLKKKIIDFITADQLPLMMKRQAKRIAGDKNLFIFESVMLTKTGQKIQVEVNSSLLKKDYKASEVLLIVRDITERKKAEEERRQMMEQMQHVQKLESLGVLAGGIAHDFNNILMGVLGNADLVLNKLQLDSPIKKNIINIKTAAKRAAGLCDQMLTYSGKCQTTIQSLNLNQVIEEITQLLRISISKKSILKCSFADNLPLVKGDVTQISQVAMNLITNASEALGDKGGVIAITTGCKKYDSAYLNQTFLGEELHEGAYVFLEVSDNGCGIDEEKISKIFDPFFSTKFTGRGLGLAAVLGIVKGHGGTLDIESEIGKGTTFKVLFPCSYSPVNKIVEKKHNFKDWQIRGSILVIDDEEDICSVAKDMLELIGFKVITTIDGRSAIEIFRQNAEEIVLILLDMTMPHMSGEEVFNEIRKIKSDARIIISSGYNEYNIKKHFANMELAGFIKKPYQLETLKEIMYEVLTCQNKLQVEHSVYN